LKQIPEPLDLLSIGHLSHLVVVSKLLSTLAWLRFQMDIERWKKYLEKVASKLNQMKMKNANVF